jgi:hypothetical protein
LIDNDRRVRIISGHYGSGKTEFAVNYVVKLAEKGGNPVLADLDIINPYFRSREKAKELQKLGVRVIGSSINAPAVAAPAVSAEINTVFDNRAVEAVIDVGGDEAGAKVISRFAAHFSHPEEYDLFVVINANRPATRTVVQVEQYIDSIEKGSGLNVTGLINTTHMLKSTSPDDLIRGWELSKKVSERTGIPVRYNVGLSRLINEIPNDIKMNFFPIELYMRDEWMS